MAAKVRDSNLIELSNIVNTDNVKPERMNALGDLDGSIAPPSEYDLFKDILHGNQSDEESEESEDETSNASVVTKVSRKDKLSPPRNVEYDDEEEEEEEYDEDESDYSVRSKSEMSSESDDNEVHLSTKDIKGIVNLKGGSDKKVDKNKDNKAHSEMLAEIERLRGVLKKRGIPIPNYKPKDIKRRKSYAKEILDSMKHLDNDNKTADAMIRLLRFVLTVLCKTFDGRHELFNYKIDLRGYKTLVMTDIKEMREETVDFASYVRRKVGISTTKLFIIFKIFILNAGLTIAKNNGDGTNNVDMFDEENDDEYSDDDDDSEEDEESGSVESVDDARK